jgi:uncharacterized UPF0146 family protein
MKRSANINCRVVRVTIGIFEKIAQNVAKHFFVKIIARQRTALEFGLPITKQFSVLYK